MWPNCVLFTLANPEKFCKIWGPALKKNYLIKWENYTQPDHWICEILRDNRYTHKYSISCLSLAWRMEKDNPGVARGRKSFKKTTGTRRVWSTWEEQMLLSSLKELVINGWKSDNGFRTGCLTKLEEAMKKVYPHTNLQNDPNIFWLIYITPFFCHHL